MRNFLARNRRLICLVSAVAAIVLPGLALAQGLNVNTTNFGLNEFGNATNLGTNIELIGTIARIINIILGFLGVLAVVAIIYGGFRYTMAAGNEKEMGESKGIMSAGLIGLIIILAAFAIASFVVNQLANSTGYNGY